MVTLTSKCFLKCKFCNIWNDVQVTLNKEDVLFLLNEADFSQILLSGGEILLEKELLFDILTEIKNFNLERIILATTGILLNEKVADKLVRLGVTDIIVPFDGMRNYHNSNRGMDCFDKIKNNIKYIIKNYPSILVTANVVISHKNVDQIPQLARYLHEEIGLQCIEFHPVKIKIGLLNMDKSFVENNFTLFYDFRPGYIKKIEQSFQELLELKKEIPTYIGNTKEGLMLIKEYLINPKMLPKRNICQVYNKVISLNYNGELSFCLETGDPNFTFSTIDEVKQYGLNTILNSKRVQDIKNRIHSCNEPCICVAYHEELEEPYLR